MSSGMIGMIASDMRQIYMSEMLREKGYQVHLVDLRRETAGGTEPKDAAEPNGGNDWETLWKSRYLILPVPVSRLPEPERTAEKIAACKDTLEGVYGGQLPQRWVDEFSAAGIETVDLMKDPAVAARNAVATAEGTIAELAALMPENIEGAHVVVTGFGRCGKVIAEKLYCMGARVAVAARSEQALALAGFFGFEALDLSRGTIPLGDADAVINTVPAMVIGKKEIDQLRKDAVVLDIASAPGGCDLEYCREKGIACKLALGLPGIYSPKASARILLQAMPF